MKRTMKQSFISVKKYKQDLSKANFVECDICLLPLELLAHILRYAVCRGIRTALLYRLVCRKFKTVVDNFLMGKEISILHTYDKVGKQALPKECTLKLRQLFPRLTIHGQDFCPYSDNDSVSDVSKLSIFNSIYFSNSENLKDISSLLGMERITLKNCSALEDISPLRETESIALSSIPKLQDVSPLQGAHFVSLHSCWKITKIPHLRSLRSIELYDLPNFTDVSALATAHRVSLQCCESITDVSPLKCVPIVELWSLQNVTDVSCLTEVEELKIVNLPEVTSLEGLEGLSKLTIAHCGVKHLPGFKNATLVKAWSCEELTSLFETPCTVKTLYVKNCRKLGSIVTLSMEDCSWVKISTLFFDDELYRHVGDIVTATKFIPKILTKDTPPIGIDPDLLEGLCEEHHIHTTKNQFWISNQDGEIVCRDGVSLPWETTLSPPCEKCSKGQNVILVYCPE